MHRPSELEVAAETDGEVIKPALFAVDGQQIGERLGRMIMTAVTGIYDWNLSNLCCRKRGTLLGVTHCDDIRITADGVDCVADCFPLRGGAGACG